MTDDWRDDFVVSSHIRLPGERAALYRAAARGLFTRVTYGVYARTEHWEGLDFEGRHLARVRAAAILRPDLVFSHLTAALLRGLPVIGGDLSVPHVLSDPAGGGRSKNGLRRHALGVPAHYDVVDGIRLTVLEQTAAHVAAGYEAELAVPILDAVLARGTSREVVRELIATTPVAHGSVRGRWAIEFADERSGSPGESLSRVAIHRLRLPSPELQVPVHDGRGLVGIVDFLWTDRDLVGEFDGVGKYLRDAFTGGRDAAEVVIDEKRREDRIRSTGLRVVRWGWDTARSAPALRRVLSEAGLRSR